MSLSRWTEMPDKLFLLITFLLLADTLKSVKLQYLKVFFSILADHPLISPNMVFSKHGKVCKKQKYQLLTRPVFHQQALIWVTLCQHRYCFPRSYNIQHNETTCYRQQTFSSVAFDHACLQVSDLLAVFGLDHIKKVSLYILPFSMPGTEATRGTDQPECLKSMCLVNILPMWPYTSMLEPEVYGSYSSHNTEIFLTSQHCLPWKLHPTDLVPQFTWVIGSRAVHTAPSANTKFFCSSSNLLPFKTTLNLILITTKTNCNPLRRLFVETSVPYNGNAVLRGFKRFSGSITEAVARAWAVWHYIIVVTCWSSMHIA